MTSPDPFFPGECRLAVSNTNAFQDLRDGTHMELWKMTHSPVVMAVMSRGETIVFYCVFGLPTGDWLI